MGLRLVQGPITNYNHPRIIQTCTVPHQGGYVLVSCPKKESFDIFSTSDPDIKFRYRNSKIPHFSGGVENTFVFLVRESSLRPLLVKGLKHLKCENL